MRILVILVLLLSLSAANAQQLECRDDYHVIACRAPLAMKVTGRHNSVQRNGSFTIVDNTELYELWFNREKSRPDESRQFKNGNCTFLDRSIRPSEPNVIELDYSSLGHQGVNKLVIDEITRCNTIAGCQFRVCVKSKNDVFDTDLTSAIVDLR